MFGSLTSGLLVAVLSIEPAAPVFDRESIEAAVARQETSLLASRGLRTSMLMVEAGVLADSVSTIYMLHRGGHERNPLGFPRCAVLAWIGAPALLYAMDRAGVSETWTRRVAWLVVALRAYAVVHNVRLGME